MTSRLLYALATVITLCQHCQASTARPFAIMHCKSAVSHLNSGLGALPQSKVIKLVSRCIENQGYKPEDLLLATSCCPDEINRDLDTELTHFGRAFCMGGLAGFPFVGKTGFGAFMHHVPNGGHMLIVCASHVGIDSEGNIGRLNRVGMEQDSSACGAAVAAYKFCEAHKHELQRVKDGDASIYPAFTDPLDSQQNYIQKVRPYILLTICIIVLLIIVMYSSLQASTRRPANLPTRWPNSQ
jgi:hypothetical protein